MNETLSSRFIKAKTGEIEHAGCKVSQMFAHPVVDGSVFSLEILDFKPLPRQGLRLRVKNGLICINEEKSSDIVLWASTCPPIVKGVVIARAPSELRVWNVWAVDDAVCAWTGNSGILIKTEDGFFSLNCSNGVGDVDFSDMTIKISLKP